MWFENLMSLNRNCTVCSANDKQQNWASMRYTLKGSLMNCHQSGIETDGSSINSQCVHFKVFYSFYRLVNLFQDFAWFHFKRLSRRKRGMASNLLFIIPDFFCIFQLNFAMAILCLKKMGKFLWKCRKKRPAMLAVSV